MNTDQEIKTGYIKVNLNYAPKTNGKKFAKWCEESGFTPMSGGRRAWSSSLHTYLRGASGVAYANGEPFLFYEEDLEEDLVDAETLITTAKIEELEKLKQYNGSIIGIDGKRVDNMVHHQVIDERIAELRGDIA